MSSFLVNVSIYLSENKSIQLEEKNRLLDTVVAVSCDLINRSVDEVWNEGIIHTVGCSFACLYSYVKCFTYESSCMKLNMNWECRVFKSLISKQDRLFRIHILLVIYKLDVWKLHVCYCFWILLSILFVFNVTIISLFFFLFLFN